MAGKVRIETVVQLINSVRSDRLVLLIRHNAKPQNVSGNFMRFYIFIIVTIMFSLTSSCSDPVTMDQEIESNAIRITKQLDSNSIKIFYTWNTFYRGIDWWEKISDSNAYYRCGYSKQGVTSTLLLLEPAHFSVDFKSDIKFDTARYHRWELENISNVLRITATNNKGDDIVLLKNKLVATVFGDDNPFEKFDSLTTLKHNLNIWRIKTPRKENYIEFYLSPQHVLTYLPDNLKLWPRSLEFRKNEFAKGKQLTRNWNYRKLDKPID